MQPSKKELRSALRIINKATLSPLYRKEASATICAKLQASELWQKATRIGLYQALPDEPDLAALLSSAGKEIFIPRVEDEQTIEFYPYDVDALQEGGAFGITEPTQGVDEAIDPASLHLVVVPGMAFTPRGIRLGRGKAFYDRYLKKTDAITIGVTFAYRVLPELPCEPWDHLMDRIICDESLLMNNN